MVSHIAGEVAALNDLLDQPQLLVGDTQDRRPRPLTVAVT